MVCNHNNIGPIFAAFGLAAMLFAGPVDAAEIKVVSSGGFFAAFQSVIPEFERQTGNTIVLQAGPSMGETHDAVPQRLARGEDIDVVIMVGYALGKFVEQGRASDRTDLAQAGIVAAVRAGAPVPDISTLDALRQTMLAAKSIAYSDSASGVYIKNEMLKKLGIEDAVKDRARMIPAEPVGRVVARGEAELGFQTMSEMKPVPGITIIGPLPAAVQKYTVFSAGLVTGSKVPDAARALIRFLASPATAKAITDSGMEPLGGK